MTYDSIPQEDRMRIKKELVLKAFDLVAEKAPILTTYQKEQAELRHSTYLDGIEKVIGKYRARRSTGESSPDEHIK